MNCIHYSTIKIHKYKLCNKLKRKYSRPSLIPQSTIKLNLSMINSTLIPILMIVLIPIILIYIVLVQTPEELQ